MSKQVADKLLYGLAVGIGFMLRGVIRQRRVSKQVAREQRLSKQAGDKIQKPWQKRMNANPKEHGR